MGEGTRRITFGASALAAAVCIGNAGCTAVGAGIGAATSTYGRPADLKSLRRGDYLRVPLAQGGAVDGVLMSVDAPEPHAPLPPPASCVGGASAESPSVGTASDAGADDSDATAGSNVAAHAAPKCDTPSRGDPTDAAAPTVLVTCESPSWQGSVPSCRRESKRVAVQRPEQVRIETGDRQLVGVLVGLGLDLAVIGALVIPVVVNPAAAFH